MFDRVLKNRRITILAVIVPLLFVSVSVVLARQSPVPDSVPVTSSTPEPPAWSCDRSPLAATDAGHEAHEMPSGEPATMPEFDQLYIDMMLPHHASIIALSEAALPHLTDPWLQELARDIIAAQSIENAQLTGWRTDWYGSAEPATDEASMNLMLQAMPVGTMDEMMFQMDPAGQIARFCTADDPNRAFLEQMIPHHQMAVDVSVIALDKAERPELLAFASTVSQEQQIEIALLAWIQSGWESAATPAA